MRRKIAKMEGSVATRLRWQQEGKSAVCNREQLDVVN
jgi:hypothetical protein